MKNKFLISNFKFLILICALFIAGFFRFYQLNQVPPSPSLDEVSIGWNAFSILETGKDEYGYRLPVLLRAYDDWRPALYVYFVIPFVKFFGLSAAVVRLPAVIFSLITIIATYFLIQELFRNSPFVSHYSLYAAFLLVISPWHIYISRLGHEVGAGLTFSVLGTLFFLKMVKATKKRRLFLFLSVIMFAFSFYTYQSQKAFGPPLIIALIIIFRKNLIRFKKEIVLAGLLGLILLIPLLKASLSPGGLIRFQGSSVFSEHTTLKELSGLRIARDYQEHSSLGLIFDSQKVATGLTFLTNYFTHFNPSWLFFNTGKEKHKIPGLGLFYLWELPLLLIGAYQLVKGKFSKETKFLIFSWLAIAPFPATLATQTPHGMRAFNLLPIPQILAALGLVFLLAKFKLKKLLKFLSLAAVSLFLFFNFGYLYHNYFVNFPEEQAGSFQYLLSQAIPYVLNIENDYQKIVFSNTDNCNQSYMFLLFFSQYDPAAYLDQGGTVSGGANEPHFFSKYEFRPIYWGSEKKEKGILYVGNAGDFPKGLGGLQTFQRTEEYEAIKIVAP